MSADARTIVGVTFDQWGRAGDYSIDPQRVQTVPGTLVIVESRRGVRMGRVTTPPRAAAESGGGRIRRVVRVAGRKDFDTQEAALAREPEAFRLALTLIRERGLALKLLKVLLDGIAGRGTFFVAAPDKLQMGDLGTVLGERLGLRVEVRQLGLRDMAKTVGGVGRCGRELCCSTHLTDYPRTSIRMAKDQNLSLNDDRTSGVCGRPMCCLAYEHEHYKELRTWLPRLGKRARTADGTLEGKVIGVDAMRLEFTLLTDDYKRHKVPARAWERNIDKEVPEPENTSRPAAQASAPTAPPPPDPPASASKKKPARRRRRRPKKDRDS